MPPNRGSRKADSMKPGTKVGAKRWPYSAAHPGCWGRPWAGLVLELTDPRAWAGTLAFPRGTPSRAEVKAHVAACEARGLTFGDRIPVLWDFGSSGLKCHWEKCDGTDHAIRPYAEDLADWFKARGDALKRAA